MKTMEQIINQIIEIEMSARRIVDEAKDRRENLSATLEAELNEIRAKHNEYTQKQLEMTKAQEAVKLQQKMREADAMQAKQLSALENAAKLNHDKWVDMIFSNTIKADI